MQRNAATTTQSHANPVSCGLWKNPRISAPFARPDRHFRSLLPVTADRRGKNAARSLARANPFPADFIPTDRDAFACRLRPVRIHGRWHSERKCRRASARSRMMQKAVGGRRALGSGRESEHSKFESCQRSLGKLPVFRCRSGLRECRANASVSYRFARFK